MSLRIRMSRAGAKKRPYYRIVVADARAPRDGSFIERVGSYDPMLPKDSGKRITLNEERIKHWLSVGAQPSDRVTKFLAGAGLAEKPAIPEQTKQHLPKAKAQERAKELEEAREAKSKAAEEAANAPAEETPAEEAAPAEDAAPAEEAAAAEEKTEEAPVEAAAEEKAEEKTEAAPAEETPAEAAEEGDAEKKDA